ncbi:MAG TPA: 6-phosphogluconolactonase [Thermoleophilaceae bacterium]|nr:6-phosphogluconolactonase [Thermoleophilaceae bacterium]
MAETLVLDDPAEECAGRLASAAAEGAHVVLTGGSTPRRCYERLAGMDVDWSSATVWFSDERCVPPDDELSNYGMAKAALLDPLGDGGPDVKRMRGEEGPSAGADDYERELRESLGESMPRLDLVLLGLGPDAHVASLFPGQPTLQVGDRPVVAVPEAGMEPFVPRISLTLPAINAARQVLLLVTGESKAEAVARACGEPSEDAPGSLVRPHSGDLTLLLDQAAASRL